MTGYADRAYAESLAEFGRPRELPRCGGWLLERAIEGTTWHDAMGCYPFFACRDWRLLADDLESLGTDLVSVTIVADPFGGHDPALLRDAFPDVCVPFKEHFVTDLARPVAEVAASHHERNARRALDVIEVAEVARPVDYLDDWVALYDALAARHGIAGLRRFSRESFARQLSTPGIAMLRAVRDGQTVGATLWYAAGDVVYYHLGAYQEAGYEAGASFALFWRAIELFGARGSRWLSLGAGAGATPDDNDGLTRFKRGWATGTRTAWLCGRVLNESRYTTLGAAMPPARYFPVYRAGEFT
jgi:hypothetical protein